MTVKENTLYQPTQHTVIEYYYYFTRLYIVMLCFVYFRCFVLPCQIWQKLSVTRARVLIHLTTRWVARTTVFRRTPKGDTHHIIATKTTREKSHARFHGNLSPDQPVKLLNPMTNKPISIFFFFNFFVFCSLQFYYVNQLLFGCFVTDKSRRGAAT